MEKLEFRTLKKAFATAVNKALFDEKLTCNACDCEMFGGKWFCDECEATLPRNNGATCMHCGRATLYDMDYCLSCKGVKTHYDMAKSVFKYEHPIDSLIKKFKYDGAKYLAPMFAEYMAELYYKFPLCADVLTFVPMYKGDLKARGYNQSGLIAKELGKLINVPVAFDGLIKESQTPRQATLAKAERLRNLEGVFKVTDKTPFEGKFVFLIDDVMTTGATLETLSAAIKKTGAKAVFCLTVASVAKGKGSLQ